MKAKVRQYQVKDLKTIWLDKEHNSHYHTFSITPSADGSHTHKGPNTSLNNCGYGMETVKHYHSRPTLAAATHAHVFSGITSTESAIDVNHTHSVSITSASEASHTHAGGTSGNGGCSSTGCTANPHNHTVGTSSVGSSHSHSLSGTTGTGSGTILDHTHSVSLSSGAGGSHTHKGGALAAKACYCASSHRHSASGTSGTEASHIHSVAGNTDSAGEVAVNITISATLATASAESQVCSIAVHKTIDSVVATATAQGYVHSLPNVAILASVASASGAGVVPTFTTTWVVTITGVVATADAQSYEHAVDTNAALVPGEVAALTGKMNVPHVALMTLIVIPIFECNGVLLPVTGFNTVIVPVMTITGRITDHQAVRVLYHSIYDALYSDEPFITNRIYVVGSDADGNLVFGNAKDDTHIAEYGERLRIVTEPAIYSSDMADTIATNMLSNTRFEADLGQIEVPPNCGLEIGDVIQITDSVANQSAKSYRVAAFELNYDPTGKITTFKHIIRLTSV